MTSPPEIRVIGLKRRGDRRAAMDAQMSQHGLPFRWLDAIDARAPEFETLRKADGSQASAYRLTPASLACALSHRQAWQDFLAGDTKLLCVMEDDVRLTQPAVEVLRCVQDMGGRWNVLKLDGTPHGSRRVLASAPQPISCASGATVSWRIWSRRLGAGCYVLTRAAASRLVASTHRFAAPVDHLLFNPVYSPLFSQPGVRVILPFPVSHDNSNSDIEVERIAEADRPEWRRVRWAREFANLKAVPRRLLAMAAGAQWKDALVDPGSVRQPGSGNPH